MNILLIDNHSKHIQEIVEELKNKENIKLARVESLKKENLKRYDAFILSGSFEYSVLSHLEIYKEELQLIKKTTKPILGICLGFELICYAYDEKLSFQKQRTRGEIELEVVKKDDILKNISKPLKVYEAHRWNVTKTKKLKTIAKSKTGSEIVKHPTKLIYGVQFHPESIKHKHREIITNFLEIIK